MESNNYGQRIREFRKKRGLTQIELAQGICNQGTLSKIEQGQISPDIDILIALAERLSVSIDYLIGSKEVYLKFPLIHEIRHCLDYTEYEKIQNLLGNKPLVVSSSSIYNQAFTTWLESIILSQLSNDKQGAIQLALPLLEKLNIALDHKRYLKINVLNSIAIYYRYLDDYQTNLVYLLQAKKLLSERGHFDISQKIYLSLANTYYHLGQYEEAIFNAEYAIYRSVENNSHYLLENLYCAAAKSYKVLNKHEKYEQYSERVKFLSKLKSTDHLFSEILENINPIFENY